MTPDDRALVERYPELPALANLLDPMSLERIGAAWGVGYILERLRLKPGASVTAVLRPSAGTRAGAASLPWLLARGLALQPWATKRNKDVRAAQKSRRSVAKAAQAYAGSAGELAEWVIPGPRDPVMVDDDERRILVTPAIGDRRLEGLRSLLPDTGIPVRLEKAARHPGLIGALPDGLPHLRRRGTVRTLSHNPARRFVGHWSPVRGDGPGCNVRLYTGARREITAFQPGRPWRCGDDLPDIGRIAADRARAAGQFGNPWTRPDLASVLMAAAAGLGTLDAQGHDWAERAHRLVSVLAPRLSRVGTAPAHGDLSDDQLVVTPGQIIAHDADDADGAVAVLDWDRAGLWPTGWDAATWMVTSALFAAVDPSRMPDRSDAAAPAFAEEPSGDVVAAVALLRAPEPFRRRYPRWVQLTEQLVTLAETNLERAGSGAVPVMYTGVA